MDSHSKEHDDSYEMKDGPRDRREHPRFLCNMELRARPPLLLGTSAQQRANAAFCGRIQNISQGGVCLLTDQALPSSSLLRCEIGVSGIPAAIPTLVHVRWAETTSNGNPCHIGLQFLL